MNAREVSKPASWHPLLVSAAFFLLLLVNVIYWTVICDSTIYLLFGLLACILLSVMVYAYRIRLLDNSAPGIVFLIALIVSCIVFAFMFPPSSVPDERHHFLSSYWLADSVTGESSLFDSSEIILREDDYLLCEQWSTAGISLHSYQSILDNFELFNQSDETRVINSEQFSISSENLVAKVGSVLGILIARFFNLGAYPLYYLGRLLNAAQFILLSFAAFRIIPTGKTIIAGVSLLPMTLHLAASYSYDGGIIGLSMLLTALTLRAIMRSQPISTKEMVSIGMVVAFLAPCKILYVSVALLLFLIPQSRFNSVRKKYSFVFVILLVACIAIVAFRITGITGLATTSTDLDYRGAESGHFYSLSDVFANPLGTISIFFKTLLANGDFYIYTLVGGSLGWFQGTIAAPHFFIFIYYLLLLVGAQKSRDDNTDIATPIKMAAILILILCLAGSMMSMFLGWTFDYETIISGVQGRYLLPVFATTLLAARWKMLYIKQPTYGLTVCGICSLNIIYAIGILGAALSLR